MADTVPPAMNEALGISRVEATKFPSRDNLAISGNDYAGLIDDIDRTRRIEGTGDLRNVTPGHPIERGP